MDYTTKICNASKNANPEDQEWETKILKYGWGTKHLKLFDDFVRILDYERLSRLANVDNKRYEAVQRRIAIDKAADRVRKALAAVSWDTPMCQWIHGLMMEFLPPSYLAAYLDIMQTLKNQLPSLIDKMIFWKPGNVNQELLAPILKKPWQPALNNKVSGDNLTFLRSYLTITNSQYFSIVSFPATHFSLSCPPLLPASVLNRRESLVSTSSLQRWRLCFQSTSTSIVLLHRGSRFSQSRSKRFQLLEQKYKNLRLRTPTVA